MFTVHQLSEGFHMFEFETKQVPGGMNVRDAFRFTQNLENIPVVLQDK